MLWQGRRASGNIEDRRGTRFGGGFGRLPTRAGAGGLGIGGIVVVLIIAWITGINPLALLSGLEGGSPVIVGQDGGGQTPGRQGVPADETGKFVATVLADTEDTWSEIFKKGGATYENPTLVLFSGQVESACGFGSAASGPFYCPNDRKLYLDLSFFRQLSDQFQAPGDFAQAYVVAHEVGHHVQNLLGDLGKVEALKRQVGEGERNQLSVRIELQADCYAGIWSKSAQARGVLEVGDIEEALNAAAKIGDDAIQERSRGYVVPETFNHGTSLQRSTWFKRGFDEGSIATCDSLSASQV